MVPPALHALSPEDVAFVRSLVIFEDQSLLAFNKPSGLASQGGRGGRPTLEGLLAAFTRSNGKRPSLVHRLDRDTTGVILAAKTKPAASLLGKALMARRVKKTYLALLAAPPEPPSGRIIKALRREEQGTQSSMRPCADDHPDAETAVTDYRTLKVGDGAVIVELSPQTGRMHQLRAHLAHLGRPILGDARYGGALVVRGEPAGRVMLHAFALEFPDPAGGRRRLTAAPPLDFARLAAGAGLSLDPWMQRQPDDADSPANILVEGAAP
jgi:tRNA pseudouridine32 synthase/23S rRNA pseudouridine746 synthase